MRPQQGGVGIIIQADIIEGIMVCLWEFLNGIKVTADVYIVFLRKHLEPLLQKQRITFKRTIIFIQDNGPSHAVYKTIEYLQQLGFCEPQKMNWLTNSPYLKA